MTRRLRAEWSVPAAAAPVSGTPAVGAGAGAGVVSDTGTSGLMGGGSFGTQQGYTGAAAPRPGSFPPGT
ncbi:hypothetical protein KTU01_12880 [Kocuria turfanensis]|uniref:Uncharacterized protein n=1 Tax=Kocuria turfanensis TaxID=388357 RepID=A0A512IBT2_9MICC|nr:hypothetical protein KTU01_12880 [Kocuria turfanensis]